MGRIRTRDITASKVTVGDRSRFRQGHNIYYNHGTSPGSPWDLVSDSRKSFDAALEKRTPGTGLWFLKSKEYMDWRAGDEQASFLVIHGRSGCGKTILSSTIIEDLLEFAQQQPKCSTKDPASAVAFYYFDSNQSDRQNTRDFLLSLISFLTAHSTADDVRMIRDQCKVDSTRRIADSVCELLEKQSRTHLVIDGLDECRRDQQIRDEILKKLKRFAKLKNLSVLITTQGGESLESIKRTFTEDIKPFVLSLPVEQIQGDIKLFIHEKLQDIGWKLEETVMGEIRKTLSSSADGMFRLRPCQVDELSRLTDNDKSITESMVREVLRTLPPLVTSYYDKILQRVPSKEKDIVISLLNWLVCMKRPLLLAEAEELVHLHFRQMGEKLAEKCLAYLLKRFSSLIDIVEINIYPLSDLESTPRTFHPRHPFAKHKLIRLSHASVREYLCGTSIIAARLAEFSIENRKAHRAVAHDCLRFLEFCDSADPHRIPSCQHCPLQRSSLMSYAVGHWYYHAFHHQEGCYPPSYLGRGFTFDIHNQSPSRFQRLFQSTFIASSFSGWINLSNKLIDDIPGGHYFNAEAVLPATIGGYWHIVRLILAHNATIEHYDFSGGIVMAAVSGEFSKLLTLLLEDLRVDEDGLKNVLLGVLSQQTWLDTFRDKTSLLGRLYDLKLLQNEETCIEFLKLLFSPNDQRCLTPEIVDIADMHGCTALHEAIRRGYTKVVEMLINAGADVNKPSYSDEYPLDLALQTENPEILAMLLEAQAVGQPENVGDDPSWQDDICTFQAHVPNHFSEHISYTWK